MSDNIIQLNEDLIKHDLKDLVRSSVEEALNALLDKEADELVNAGKYERSRENLLYLIEFVEVQCLQAFGKSVKSKVRKTDGWELGESSP